MSPLRVLVCATQVPLVHGGAELHVEGLVDALSTAGHRVDTIRLPFAWGQRESVLASALQWRLLEIPAATGPVDLVIATRFPSYLIRHPRKVVWLIHQYRQVYDLRGTPFSDVGNRPGDQRFVERITAMDALGFGEAERIYANAGNTARRLARYNGFEAETLYPPPRLSGRYRAGPFEDYVLGVGRLEAVKRFDLLIEAAARSTGSWALKIAGRGPEAARLAEMVSERGLEDRVELLGFVSDEDLLELYAHAGAVAFPPFDEDFGYITVEAFQSSKPVVTTRDAGGPLELVRDGVNGLVTAPTPHALGRALDRLIEDRPLARRLGEAGREAVAGITWDRVLERLLED